MQSDVLSYLILIYYIATPDEMYTDCTGSCKSNYLGGINWQVICNIICDFSEYKSSKMTNKKYHTVGSVPKSNREMTEDDNIDIPNTHGLW